MKNGRYGSSTVRLLIQAPEKPSATNTSGPMQQVDARMAAMPLAASALLFFGFKMTFSLRIFV